MSAAWPCRIVWSQMGRISPPGPLPLEPQVITAPPATGGLPSAPRTVRPTAPTARPPSAGAPPRSGRTTDTRLLGFRPGPPTLGWQRTKRRATRTRGSRRRRPRGARGCSWCCAARLRCACSCPRSKCAPGSWCSRGASRRRRRAAARKPAQHPPWRCTGACSAPAAPRAPWTCSAPPAAEHTRPQSQAAPPRWVARHRPMENHIVNSEKDSSSPN